MNYDRGRNLKKLCSFVFLVFAICCCYFVWTPALFNYWEIEHKTICVNERLCTEVSSVKQHISEILKYGQRSFASISLDKAFIYIKQQLDALVINNTSYRGEIEMTNSNYGEFITPTFYFNSTRSFAYNNVTNLLYTLRSMPEEKSKKISYLFNCHVDSVITSPGASDNAINCAIMLDIIRALVATINSNKTANFKQNVDMMFLFNGAEERSLIGSAVFVQSSKFLSANIQGILNLDASSSAQRDFLFRITRKNSWMLHLYKQAAFYPLATVLAHEIYETGVVPSTTDFDIFQRFSNASMIDVAFVGNGYYYHTNRDTLDAISDAAIAKAYRNYAGILYHLYTNLETTYANNVPIYFDYLGLYMFVWSVNYYCIIITAITIIFLYRCYCYSYEISNNSSKTGTRFFFGISIAAISIILSNLCATLCCLCFALFLHKFGANMLWISNERLLFGCYSILYVFVCLHLLDWMVKVYLTSKLEIYQSKNQIIELGQNFIGVILLWVLFMLNIHSSYVILMGLFPNIMSWLTLSILKKCYVRNSIDYSIDWFHMLKMSNIVNALYLIPIIAYFAYLRYYILLVILPATGRTPSDINTELYFAVLVCSFCFILIFTATPFLRQIRRHLRYPLMLVGVIGVILFFYIILGSSTGLIHAFSKVNPKRLPFSHANIHFVDDSNSHLGPAVNSSYLCIESVDNRYLRDLPANVTNSFFRVKEDDILSRPETLFFITLTQTTRNHIYLRRTKAHHANPDFNVRLVDKLCDGSICRYNMKILGRGIIDIALVLKGHNSTLINSSLNFEATTKTYTKGNLKTYSMIIVKGEEKPFDFSLSVLNPLNGESYIAISVDSNEVTMTEQIDAMTKQLPSYINPLNLVKSIYILFL